MKKIIFGIVGIMSVMIPALADVSSDTAKLKAACQASDKTLWVERNQVCIPKNPCKDSKFEQYCNRDFKNVQIQELGYKILIEAYAGTHDLECLPVDTKSKLIGQDYVVCMGDDVMVFEFDDISEYAFGFDAKKRDANYMWDKYPYVCRAINGQSGVDNRTRCYDTTEANCLQLKSILQKYLVDDGVRWEDNVCVISISDNNGAEYF